MLHLDGILGILVTGLIWGITDPLMKKFGSEEYSQNTTLSQILPFLGNWRYACTFATNQLGSVTFLWTLSRADLSLAVPIANGLKILFTVVTGQLLGEDKISAKSAVGLVLITAGVLLQLYGK